MCYVLCLSSLFLLLLAVVGEAKAVALLSSSGVRPLKATAVAEVVKGNLLFCVRAK